MGEVTKIDDLQKQLFNALAQLQYDMPTVHKDKENPFFKSKYADLSSVVESATPLLKKHKLAVIQQLDHLSEMQGETTPALTTIVVHEAGGRLESTTPLILPKQDPQAQGSAITYARRYAFMTAVGMVADDDDGNSAVSSINSQAKPNIKFNMLATKKQDIMAQMEERGITEYTDFIKTVLGKTTVDTVLEANKVMDALDEYKD